MVVIVLEVGIHPDGFVVTSVISGYLCLLHAKLLVLQRKKTHYWSIYVSEHQYNGFVLFSYNYFFKIKMHKHWVIWPDIIIAHFISIIKIDNH